jgi:acid phosphatase (class A)
MVFGSQKLQELFNTKPHTANLLATSLYELDIVILHYKKQYDRVRPSWLDTSITTTIAVPPHPSYPSGHATQSYFIALILGELDSKNAEVYIEDANRVAHNREIAGVHYPSDSTAGQDLARQYFTLIKETEWYKNSLAEAKKEW